MNIGDFYGDFKGIEGIVSPIDLKQKYEEFSLQGQNVQFDSVERGRMFRSNQAVRYEISGGPEDGAVEVSRHTLNPYGKWVWEIVPMEKQSFFCVEVAAS